MNFQSTIANGFCLNALRKARGDITSPADEHIIDAIEALRRGLYGPSYTREELEFYERSKDGNGDV